MRMGRNKRNQEIAGERTRTNLLRYCGIGKSRAKGYCIVFAARAEPYEV